MRLNVGSSIAEVAVSTTGMYSGRHPAMTALAATLPTVIPCAAPAVPDNLRRRASTVFQELGHPLLRRRDHRKAVGPAQFIAAFDGFEASSQLTVVVSPISLKGLLLL